MTTVMKGLAEMTIEELAELKLEVYERSLDLERLAAIAPASHARQIGEGRTALLSFWGAIDDEMWSRGN